MLENQNAFQHAGTHGYSYYVSIGNQTSTVLVLMLAFVLLVALLRSEERCRKLVERMMPAPPDC